MVCCRSQDRPRQTFHHPCFFSPTSSYENVSPNLLDVPPLLTSSHSIKLLRRQVPSQASSATQVHGNNMSVFTLQRNLHRSQEIKQSSPSFIYSRYRLVRSYLRDVTSPVARESSLAVFSPHFSGVPNNRFCGLLSTPSAIQHLLHHTPAPTRPTNTANYRLAAQVSRPRPSLLLRPPLYRSSQPLTSPNRCTTSNPFNLLSSYISIPVVSQPGYPSASPSFPFNFPFFLATRFPPYFNQALPFLLFRNAVARSQFERSGPTPEIERTREGGMERREP